jgi:hypothetical protein
MPAIPPAGRVDLPRWTVDQFIDVVCAEEDLLRAEFEAIVAAEWPEPPSRHPGPPPTSARRPVERRLPAIRSTSDPTPPDRGSRTAKRGRGRSPPGDGGDAFIDTVTRAGDAHRESSSEGGSSARPHVSP